MLRMSLLVPVALTTISAAQPKDSDCISYDKDAGLLRIAKTSRPARNPITLRRRFVEDTRRFFKSEHRPSARFSDPTTAVIVGAGTVGTIAAWAAAEVLPAGSTIHVLQRGWDPVVLARQFEKLSARYLAKKALTWHLSPSLELVDQGGIRAYLESQKLADTTVYIHTADHADRVVPDALPRAQARHQILERESVSFVSDEIKRLRTTAEPLFSLVVSSECGYWGRNQIRVPNLGPYQLAKNVGDELFISQEGDNEIKVLLYAGPMATLGQVRARTEEHRILQRHGKQLDVDAGSYVKKMARQVDVDPMASAGALFDAAFSGKVAMEPGRVYQIFGISVNRTLNESSNKVLPRRLPEHMWPALET